MARKGGGESIRQINVAIVGLSGGEKDKGHTGVGKSCLCNRFIRPHAEDYNIDHISVLSQTDFSGRVVNNDHFLYWGETIKSLDESTDYQFSLIEQTEFIDDASFQPFKGGKMEPYVKRCTSSKITSAEKLMYICKNQLGIEKEYEQKILPDGRMNIDGFICVFDVSIVPSRLIEKQIDFCAAILNNILKIKKPIVIISTKNDEADDLYVREVHRLVQRSEYKGNIPLVESSAHENVNIDLGFLLLAQIIEKTKVRLKIPSYSEAALARKEIMDAASDAFMRLIRIHVTDCHSLWSQTQKKLNNHKEWIHFVQLFGLDGTQRLFKRHIKKLKDENMAKQVARYMEMLPEVLHDLIPGYNSLQDNNDWQNIQQYIKNHPNFSQYFFERPEDMPWSECVGSDSEETRIPYDVLDTSDAETVFKNHINLLQLEQKRLEYKKQFKQLLEDTGYVTPGKHLSEVRVLFMGRECFEALTEHDCQQIYDAHQRELIENAKHNFQELLLEHADLFYHFKSIAPTGTITQDDIKEITDTLQEDFRYKILDRLDQDRKLTLFQHLGFIHYPIREHCPAFPNCMDSLIERILATKAHRPSSWNHSNQWLLSSDNNQLNLLILGLNNLADNLAAKIRAQCDDDEYEIDCQFYSLDYRIINGDVSLPHNSFKTSDFVPHGSFCVYSNAESFEYIRESLEKKLLSNLEQDDKLPFQGLPIVLMYLQDSQTDEKEVLRLKEDGQNLADSLQCPFMDVSLDQITEEQLVSDALHQLVQSIHHRAGFLNINQSVIECVEPDIRVIMCMFCGDPYSVENVLSPLLNHQFCFLSSPHSVILETFLGDSKRKVEVIVSSFHGANAFRDELIHGFILVFSTKRKASLATLNAFSMNIPNLPIQILAVTDAGSASAFFNDDISQLLITEGNSTADRLGAHFMTSSASMPPKTAFFTPFFKEVWEKKPEIEQAFHMEEPSGLDSGEGTLERSRSTGRHHYGPMPPPRNESYYLKLGVGGNNEMMGGGGGAGSESENFDLSGPDDKLSLSDQSDRFSSIYMYGSEGGGSMGRKQRHNHSGLQVYPPPATPPEPAPPDNTRYSKKSLIDSSQTSLDDNYVMDAAPIMSIPGSAWNNYQQHAFTTGRRHHNNMSHFSSSSNNKSRSGSNNNKGLSQTLKQPGKLNMKNYSAVTEAIARMNMNDGGGGGGGNAPLATPEPVDLGCEYAQVKDLVHNLYPPSSAVPPAADSEYMYTMVQDALMSSSGNKTKLRQRREKGQPSYSDSDSEWSSLERRQRASEIFSKVNRKPGGGTGGTGNNTNTTHKRQRKKRIAIPVQPPRVPQLGAAFSSTATTTTTTMPSSIHSPASLEGCDGDNKININIPLTESNSESSEVSENEQLFPPSSAVVNLQDIRMKFIQKRSQSLKKRSIDLSNAHNFNMLNSLDLYTGQGHHHHHHHHHQQQNSSYLLDEESSLDAVSSPRDNNSSSSPMFGVFPRMKETDIEKLLRKREKQKQKDDSKLEKRRLKEEKLRKVAEEKDRKRQQKTQNKKITPNTVIGAASSGTTGAGTSKLADYIQSDKNYIPIFMEKCVRFVENEGLDSEGIYRVPGNRAHVDLLFLKFEEDSNVDIHELDIPVNAAATALKDFVSKRLPPLFDENVLNEMEEIAGTRMKPMVTTTGSMEVVKADRSCRLLALRQMLDKLPQINFAILKFMFQHFVRVTENSKLNSMDSKNMAICWWPTLLPIEFSDMGRFEQMRPYLEDIVQTMIDQYPFLFCGKEAFVMV